MHPALSIVVFTVASGAGYGLLFWLGLLALLGQLPAGRAFGGTAVVLALLLAGGGLVASSFHLGHPERAWRAFSQWRSSWLSREAVAAVLTVVPALVFAAGWVVVSETGRPEATLGSAFGIAAFALAGLSLVTVVCTAMIYVSLRPVHQWHNGWVLPGYLALSLATGAVWLNGLAALFGAGGSLFPALAAVAIAVAWLLKAGYWLFIDTSRSPGTPESATGLGDFGPVRLLDPPHTEESYLQKEMGFRIARKHAEKLRRIAHGAGFALPLLLTGLALPSPGWLAALLGLAAAVVMTAGVLIERWLFFAEARHTVMLYYGERPS